MGRKVLEMRNRLQCVKAVLGKAGELWPLAELPEVPLAPIMSDAKRLTVEQLKAVLRRHGGKVSGRKAELVDRVTVGNLLELDHRKQLKEHEQVRNKAIARRAPLQEEREQRSHSIRQVGIES